jgi:hypothetical protein
VVEAPRFCYPNPVGNRQAHKGGKTMKTYEITVRFTTDRELTEEEKGHLQLQVIAQVEEPVNAEGDDVNYSTGKIYISDIKKVKVIN